MPRLASNGLTPFEISSRTLGIPLPQCNAREGAHLRTCLMCQQAWHLAWTLRRHPLRTERDRDENPVPELPPEARDLREMSEAWCGRTETQREVLFEEHTSELKQWLHHMTRTRIPSGYQLFMGDRSHENPDISFATRTRVFSQMWRTSGGAKRAEYRARSMRLRVVRDEILAELPPFLKNHMRQAERVASAERRRAARPKPEGAVRLNSWMVFLKKEWEDALEAHRRDGGPRPKYHDVMRSSAQRWRSTQGNSE